VPGGGARLRPGTPRLVRHAPSAYPRARLRLGGSPFWATALIVGVLFVPAYLTVSLALDWAARWLKLELTPLLNWLYTLKPPV
jgi:hypothetical protein